MYYISLERYLQGLSKLQEKRYPPYILIGKYWISPLRRNQYTACITMCCPTTRRLDPVSAFPRVQRGVELHFCTVQLRISTAQVRSICPHSKHSWAPGVAFRDRTHNVDSCIVLHTPSKPLTIVELNNRKQKTKPIEGPCSKKRRPRKQMPSCRETVKSGEHPYCCRPSGPDALNTLIGIRTMFPTCSRVPRTSGSVRTKPWAAASWKTLNASPYTL